MSLLVSEIFDSIQGEGPWNGVPSTFLRLSGCPLRCVWCDTPYASHRPEGEQYTLEALGEKLAQNYLRHVVLTGGEPFMFPEFPELIELLRSGGHVVTVETSGVIYRESSADLIVLSPKLQNSDPTPQEGFSDQEVERHGRLRNDCSSLSHFANCSNEKALKFVVENDVDLEEVRAIRDLFPKIPNEMVFLMPQARRSDALAELSKQVARWCSATGWRLGTRLQVQLWDDQRGV